jgi:hypothetical protein
MPPSAGSAAVDDPSVAGAKGESSGIVDEQVKGLIPDSRPSNGVSAESILGGGGMSGSYVTTGFPTVQGLGKASLGSQVLDGVPFSMSGSGGFTYSSGLGSLSSPNELAAETQKQINNFISGNSSPTPIRKSVSSGVANTGSISNSANTVAALSSNAGSTSEGFADLPGVGSFNGGIENIPGFANYNTPNAQSSFSNNDSSHSNGTPSSNASAANNASKSSGTSGTGSSGEKGKSDGASGSTKDESKFSCEQAKQKFHYKFGDVSTYTDDEKLPKDGKVQERTQFCIKPQKNDLYDVYAGLQSLESSCGSDVGALFYGSDAESACIWVNESSQNLSDLFSKTDASQSQPTGGNTTH